VVTTLLGDTDVTSETWDRRHFSLALEVSTWSKDPSTQVGAVCVSPDKRQLVPGFNGFASGIADTHERLQNKELKNMMMVHAELNCIINSDVLLHGWTMYVTKAPCTICASAIINAGIIRMVCPSPGGSWKDSQLFAISMLTEANVKVNFYGE